MRPFPLLFIGDVVGFVGLRALLKELPSLKEKFAPRAIVVNGENIVDGKGLSDKEADELFAAGVDVITTGNHIWENWKARPLLAANRNVLRPANYPEGNPGRGVTTVTLQNGVSFSVVQLQGRAYMQNIDCPFRAADTILNKLVGKSKMILVDFHADASAEKIAMGWYLDGRVSAVLGTHTHTQTADAQILPDGTAFISDVGMTGPYDSVLGMKKDIAIRRLLLQTAHKYETAENDVRICGAFLVLDEETGTAISIEPFMTPRPRTTMKE